MLLTEIILVSQSINFEIWHSLLVEALSDRKVDFEYSKFLYETTASCYGTGQTYHAHTAFGDVDLTDLFDKTVMLAKLKGL